MMLSIRNAVCTKDMEASLDFESIGISTGAGITSAACTVQESEFMYVLVLLQAPLCHACFKAYAYKGRKLHFIASHFQSHVRLNDLQSTDASSLSFR